jgi:hypothetical protein
MHVAEPSIADAREMCGAHEYFPEMQDAAKPPAISCREERDTDKSERLCRERYSVYADSLSELAVIEKMMPVYTVDAGDSMEICRHRIASALVRHRHYVEAQQPQAKKSCPGAPRPAAAPAAPSRHDAVQQVLSWHGWAPRGLVWS